MIVTQEPVNNSILSLHLGNQAVAEGQRNDKFSLNCKFGHSCARVMKNRLYDSWVRVHVAVHLGLNVNSSTHTCGCVVDGGNAMAVYNFSIIIIIIIPLSYYYHYY